MEDEYAQQLVAELLAVNEQAFSILASAIGDVIGRTQLSQALEARLTTAQRAAPHPIRDDLLRSALKSLKAS